MTWDASCLEVPSLNHDENVNEVDSWIDTLDTTKKPQKNRAYRIQKFQ